MMLTGSDACLRNSGRSKLLKNQQRVLENETHLGLFSCTKV